ncbi:unnamed protein product [Rhizophagus irregularis]|nr:unnamed protein product [Rhizophagus irregularis]CAB5335465.1 unnamed protein product [Rhizophagus irregularis]
MWVGSVCLGVGLSSLCLDLLFRSSLGPFSLRLSLGLSSPRLVDLLFRSSLGPLSLRLSLGMWVGSVWVGSVGFGVSLGMGWEWVGVGTICLIVMHAFVVAVIDGELLYHSKTSGTK